MTKNDPNSRRPIVITTGEPAGVGPELIVGLLQEKHTNACLTVIGDADLLLERARMLGLGLSLSGERLIGPGMTAAVEQVPLRAPSTPGCLDRRNVDFEYDGEMTVDVALNQQLLSYYPFSRLSRPANILIMPELHSASIASRLLGEVGAEKKIGPLLTGLNHSAQIVRVGANVSEVVTMALFAAYSYDSPEKSLEETKKIKKKA